MRITMKLTAPITDCAGGCVIINSDLPDECPECGRAWVAFDCGQLKVKADRCECGWFPKEVTINIPDSEYDAARGFFHEKEEKA